MREPPSGDARLRAIVDRVADGVLVLDDDGVIRFANPAAETLFDRSRAELLGAPYGFPVVAGETTEIDILRKGGDPVTAELRVVETEWEGENAYLISLRDITDRKRAEEHARELTREQAIRAQAEAEEERFRRLAEEKTRLAEENAQLYERAQEANRAKSEFLAVMSHELRTPLNVITGYTELIESGVSGTVSDTQRDQLTRIRVSSRHLLELVDDILTFSRLDSGRDVVHPKSIDFFDLAREEAALSRPLVEQKGLSLDVDTPDGKCSGETDPVKLRQILLNLLSNAVKFTEHGGVRLEAREAKGEIVFRVCDSGIGIPQDMLARIWEPFWQVEQSRTRTVGGTGLGLSVVRKLTDLMGGRVAVESTPGKGTVFSVHLPLRTPTISARTRDASSMSPT